MLGECFRASTWRPVTHDASSSGVVFKRMQMVAASVATAAVLLYGLAGHGLHNLTAHGGVSSAAAALCLLLVIAVGYVAVAKPEGLRQAVDTILSAEVRSDPPRPDGRARASPIALQRFRN